MGRRTFALLRAVVLLPGNAVVVIPGVLLYLDGKADIGWGEGAAVIVAGGLLIVLGMAMAVHTVRLFLRHGEGTPAPWEPPRNLVIKGAYRYTRNPMISSIIFILIGEGLVAGSRYILIWASVFFVANHFYLVLSEESGLERRFGQEYLEYKKHVPRWIPRLRPYIDNWERSH